jgi:hypothetical protein
MKTPNTKFQDPEKLQAPNIKCSAMPNRIWSLGFGSSSDLGAWILEL